LWASRRGRQPRARTSTPRPARGCRPNPRRSPVNTSHTVYTRWCARAALLTSVTGDGRSRLAQWRLGATPRPGAVSRERYGQQAVCGGNPASARRPKAFPARITRLGTRPAEPASPSETSGFSPRRTQPLATAPAGRRSRAEVRTRENRPGQMAQPTCKGTSRGPAGDVQHGPALGTASLALA
jgi:hypothetical protein